MRNLYVAVGLALCSTSVLAADFGMGISARSNDGILYVPIDISKSFRIEPNVRYASTEVSFSQDTGQDTRDTQETETLEIGVGVFGMKQITDAAHIYFGGRVSYVDAQSTSTDAGSFGLDLRTESDQDGYIIAPTVGFEYLFAQHFSVGGEFSYQFLDIEGESRSRLGSLSESVFETEQKTQSTQTRLIFRYMF